MRGLKRGFFYLRPFPSITYKKHKLESSDAARLAVLRVWNAEDGAANDLYVRSLRDKEEFVDYIRERKSKAAKKAYAAGVSREF